MLNQKRSQIAIVDLFMAISIFTILIGTIMFTWYMYALKLNDRISYDDMTIKAFHVSGLLVKDQGKPKAWEKNITNLEVIGLADRDRILLPNKVKNFTKLNYNDTKLNLSLDIYDFYFKLTDFEGDILQLDGILLEKGYQPPTEIKHVINLKRYILFENEEAIMEFKLWK